MATCPQCGQDNPAGFRFCGACGATLEVEPEREERKVVTALFADIVGSTASAEQLDPEDVRARLAPYYARVRTELERFGGTVEKFIGDAVVALFGAPVAHEDDPERAVRAAFAVRDAIADLNAADAWLDLHIRMGVNTGEALVVLGAKTTEGEGMAAGDVMNTAARLQSAAPVDGIVVSEATYEATADAIEYRAAEPVQAKGKTEPLRVWEAVAARRVPTRRAPSRVPLVGREAELEVLAELWQRVRDDRRPGLATVLGAPGIGKSRLLVEFASRATDASVHWGRCLSYGEGITYWPVAEIFKDAAGILVDDDEGAITAKLGALLEGLPTDDADELRTMAAALANLMGVRATPLGTYSAGEITQAELHWGIRRLLQLLADRTPLVLVFEDLHWAEPTLLDLLLSIVVMTDDAPILLVGSARPELAESRPAMVAEDTCRRVLELEALSGNESQALLAELLESEGVPRGRLDVLLEAAGGNPLFLEETVGMLVDAGTLEAPEDELAARVEELAVPRSLQALIGSRLDQLDPSAKRIAQNASVVGAVFWPGAVAHLNGTEGDLDRGLEALERRDFIRAHEISTVAGEHEYAFKHVLIRDVAYGQVPKGRRVELHVRFADWVEALPAGEEEFVEIVAYHLEQSCRLAREVARSPIPPPVLRAADLLNRAAEKAERREGIREAARFYERALEAVGDELPETATELRLKRGRTRTALGELRQASDELLDVAEQALALRRSDLRCGALVGLAVIDQAQGSFAQARRRLTEAQSIAVGIDDRVLQIRAGYELGTLSGDFEGDLDGALEELQRALAIAEELDERELRLEGHLRMGTALFNGGELAQAEEHFLRCIALAEQLGSHRDEARSTFMLGATRYYRADIEEAERLALQAHEWLERTCESMYQIQNLRQLAFYALAKGDPRRAEDWLREALPSALEVGGWQVIEIYRYLVEALVAQDRLDDARDLAEFAGRNVSGEDPYVRASVLLAEASIAAAENHRGEATKRFREALRLLEEERSPLVRAEAQIDLARALRRLGDREGARVELQQARETFERMGANGLVGEIDRELSELASGAGIAGPARS
jgi:class 3 adenylate cyclase/tetratricopeptide (TPR) repeat protein